MGIITSFSSENFIISFKKRNKIFGVQHGGSLFLTQKDKLHNDSDYIFCNKFLSYGLNKSFKQSHPEGTKIIETGCYKEPYINKILKNKKIIKNNIIYVPINLNNFFKTKFSIISNREI